MRIDISDLEELIQLVGVNLYDIPNSIKERMLKVVSEHVSKHIKKNAASTGMLAGKYNLNRLKASVVSVKKSEDGEPYIEINFKGMQHGNRNAEVAFVNEYGTGKQKARPFISEACYDGLVDSVTECEDILLDFVESALEI